VVEAGTADPGGTCGPLLAKYFAQQGVSWSPFHTVRAASVLFSMVGAGITAGVVPAMAAPRPAPADVVLRPFSPGLHRTVYISRDAKNAYVDDFANLLVKSVVRAWKTGPVDSSRVFPNVSALFWRQGRKHR
jgi:DNA-binding transcriptional LysR family regulator